MKYEIWQVSKEGFIHCNQYFGEFETCYLERAMHDFAEWLGETAMYSMEDNTVEDDYGNKFEFRKSNGTENPLKGKDVYYNTLENIRRSGICNMFGASEVLRSFYPELTRDGAKEILLDWMENYEELCEKHGWRK